MDYDHIDPRWLKGRDYQLVCGFDENCNRAWIDTYENKSKSNRFLPWSVSSDSLGVAPQVKGDLCLFLDPETEEWVLEEFLGEWWFTKTKSNCGPAKGGQTNVKTGHADFLQELGRVKGGLTQGPITGRNNVESGLLQGISRLGGLVTGSLPWWVNRKGETKRSLTAPEGEWQRGRKWKET
jgi:hypothetical protein